MAHNKSLPSTLCLCALLLLILDRLGAAITIDGSVVDRRFDGHGGLSAGASSRLLFDYPEPQRSEILDFLWLPNFGAQLHICKVVRMTVKGREIEVEERREEMK